MPKYGTNTSWQYVTEDSNGNPTTSVRFKLPGIITSAPTDAKWNTKTYRGLKPTGQTDNRGIDIVTQSKNEYSFSLSYIPLKRSTTPKYDFRHFHNMAMNASSGTTLNGAWTYGTSITTSILTFSLFKETSALQQWIKGCRLSRVTVRCALDSPVEVTAEGFGTLASNTDLARTDATTLKDGTPFMWSDCQVYIDGALATFCTAFEYSIDNRAESQHTLGNRDPRDISLSGRELSLKITRQFNELGEYNAAKAGTAKSVTITMSDSLAGTVNIGFRSCRYSEYPWPGENENVLTHELSLMPGFCFTN